MNYTEKQHFREQRVHGTRFVPWQYYECRLPEYYAAVPLHCHEELELMILRKGCGHLILDGEELLLHPGCICLILPDQIHGLQGNMVYDTLVFSGSLFPGTLEERSFQEILAVLLGTRCSICQPVSSNTPGYPGMAQAVSNVFSAVKEDTAAGDLLLKSALLRLICELSRNRLLCRKPAQASLTSEFRPVLRHIQDHYQEKIAVSDLAAIMHLSESHFLHRFRQAFGTSPLDYINQIRIQKACLLLAQTDQTIARTALDAGFPNLANFNRQFRKKTGKTPSQYRKDLSQEPPADFR